MSQTDTAGNVHRPPGVGGGQFDRKLNNAPASPLDQGESVVLSHPHARITGWDGTGIATADNEPAVTYVGPSATDDAGMEFRRGVAGFRRKMHDAWTAALSGHEAQRAHDNHERQLLEDIKRWGSE